MSTISIYITHVTQLNAHVDFYSTVASFCLQRQIYILTVFMSLLLLTSLIRWQEIRYVKIRGGRFTSF